MLALLRLMEQPQYRVRWLVSFLVDDLGASLETLSERDRLSLCTEVAFFAIGTADVSRTKGQVVTRVWNDGRQAPFAGSETVVATQQRVRQGVELLTAGETWVISDTVDRLEVRPPLTRPSPRDPGSHEAFPLRRQYVGSLSAAFLQSAADVLVENWSRLGCCAWEQCRSLYLRHGRREYCRDICGKKARWARFIAKGGGRRRDYSAEYERRIKRKYGPKVRVRRRS